MPVITLDIGKIPKEKKAALIKEYTRVSTEITGIPERAFIVLIKEIDHENVGVGGIVAAESHKGL